MALGDLGLGIMTLGSTSWHRWESFNANAKKCVFYQLQAIRKLRNKKFQQFRINRNPKSVTVKVFLRNLWSKESKTKYQILYFSIYKGIIPNWRQKFKNKKYSIFVSKCSSRHKTFLTISKFRKCGRPYLGLSQLNCGISRLWTPRQDGYWSGNDLQLVPGFPRRCSGMYPERFHRVSVSVVLRKLRLI